MGVIPLTSRAEVAIVDGINLNVLARVATFAHPQDVVAAPDGRTVYVLEAGTSRAPGRTIAILDARERRIVRRITLERCTMPHWGQPSVDGRTLFVTCAPERAVIELDVGDWRERRRWVTPDPVPWMFVVPKEGDRIYMANFDAGTLSIVRDPSAAPKTVRLGGRPVGIAERPDGSEVWVSSTETDSLHIFDARRDSLVASMPSGGGGPVRIAFTSDGAKALITQSRTGVVDIFDTRTRARIARIEVPGFPKGILIRPDDRVAYVSAVDSSTITAIDIARGRSLGSVKIEGAPERMAWLPSAAWPTP
jgi:DNA-binding beta-propeller fold protein YncE